MSGISRRRQLVAPGDIVLRPGRGGARMMYGTRMTVMHLTVTWASPAYIKGVQNADFFLIHTSSFTLSISQLVYTKPTSLHKSCLTQKQSKPQS